MYYSYKSKLYTKEELAAMTFSDNDKPEPLFTLEEVEQIYFKAHTHGCLGMNGEMEDYFKQQFNITL